MKSACAPGNVQVSEQEYKKLQNEGLKESLIERNIPPPDVVRVCPKTIRAWDKKLGLHNNAVLKKTTEAKIKACNDVRNAVSFCAMKYLTETVVPPELKFNVDFIHYNPTTADSTKTLSTPAKVCGSTKSHAHKGGPTPVCAVHQAPHWWSQSLLPMCIKHPIGGPSRYCRCSSSTRTAYYIKWYALISFSG